MSKSRLGKGLGALISENDLDKAMKDGKVKEIFIEQIEPNPYQPRQEFEKEKLEELARSIKDNGIIQPITLRQVKPELFQLVTGERRWRAAQMAGLKKVPALINDYSDQQLMELALIENLQREDLNPIEEAQAYEKIMSEFKLTQEDVAQKVGKSRSGVANTLRLLNLPTKIQVYVSRETITMGHARALLALKDTKKQLEVAEHIIKRSLSVRETEEYINRLNNPEDRNKKRNKVLAREWLELEKMLADYLGTKVRIKNKKNKKLVTIECRDMQEMERLLKRMNAS